MTRYCLVGVLFAVSACSWVLEANPNYCADNADCTDPAYSYCDSEGTLEGIKNRCVASPFDAGPSCQGSAECTVDTAPICSPGGECQPCTESADGDGDCTDKNPAKPICAADGACVAGCQESSECPADDPICSDDNQCQDCDDATAVGDSDCLARDSTLPRCTAAGTCVECLGDGDCGGNTPVCSLEPGLCRACERHSECPSEVCNWDAGSCAAATAIIYVALTGTDSASCGAQLSPCRTIAGAQGGLAKVDIDHPMLRVREGLYNESIEVDGTAVRIVGTEVTVSPPGSTNDPAVLVTDSQVELEGLTLANASGGNDADGVRCSGSSSTVALYLVAIAGNDDTGLQTTDCAITVDRSEISHNDGGGISIRDAAFAITNSFIVDNGDAGATTWGGVKIDNGAGYAPQLFDFNTVARNRALDDADSSGVDCTTGTAMVATNSIVYGGIGDAPAVDGCSWAYSDIESAVVVDGEGNISAPPKFVDDIGGDYHLQSDSPCLDKANTSATMTVDFDGDPRPAGAADMGADEITP